MSPTGLWITESGTGTTRTLADQLQEEDTHGTVAEGERGVGV